MATPIAPKHVEFLDEHFQISPDWTSFQKRLGQPGFRDAVRQDPRSDRKLKRFAKMVGMRQESSSRGVRAPSDVSGEYTIRYHPEVNRFSCTCGDWTYKKSVKNRGPGGDCKHIQRLKQNAKEKLKSSVKTASPTPWHAAFDIGRAVQRRDRMEDKAKSLSIKHKAFKKSFPQDSLVEMYFKKAAMIGRVAGSLLGK